MARNIEIKSRLIMNFADVSASISRVADSPEPVVLHQVDTYFKANAGRLKLRVMDGEAQLIAYARQDMFGPKLSSYQITDVVDADAMRNLLAEALGVVAEVRKTRLAFFKNNVRIHLDEVEMLGNFLELEVALDPHEPESSGISKAQETMAALHISSHELVDTSYVDLLISKGSVK